MSSNEQPVKILAPESFRNKLTRRSLFRAGGAAAGIAILAACGDNKIASSNTPGAGTTAPGGTTPATATGGTAAAGSSAVGDSGTGLGVATGDWSRVTNKSSGSLNMYTWGAYNDPDIVGALAEKDLGVKMQVSYYTSNEDLITKLQASKGTSGFDIVVPTGPYIPQMIQNGLLEKFDKTKLPNMVNVDPLYLAQAWDPTNDYSVCKDWGSTGWFYDKTKIKTPINTWNDFIAVCQGEGSKNCSVLDTAVNVAGMYFWANGIDWNTEKVEDLDAAEKFLVNDFATHIKAFDSYPSDKIAEGAYSVSMMWNGDARAAYPKISDAGGNVDDWVWGLGAPQTELWMDNYCIAAGAPNPDAAHAWIDWILIPEVSIKDLDYHGYNSGMKNMSQLLKELKPDLTYGDMIFFKDEQVKTMKTQVITPALDRLVDIMNKVKAAAGA
ncbi:MAG: spermidine/putrescine transport system substrate-binding protein [Ilumatobacteraceae bacterium]